MGEYRKPIRILLADNRQLLRRALAQLIDTFPGMSVVAEAGDTRELLEAANRQPVDVALVDAAMPSMSGLEATLRLRRSCPAVQVLMLAMHEGEDFFRRALEIGACGFIRKDASVDELEDAIRRASVGEPIRRDDGRATNRRSSRRPPALTRRQREVLALIVDGCRNKDIAERLDLSIKTVETHRTAIMRRLGVERTATLVREAIRLGLLEPDYDGGRPEHASGKPSDSDDDAR